MSWMDRVSAMLARKSSRAGAAVAAVGLAPARWTPRRYDRLAEEGYRKNVVAYRCVREVARACASVPWLLYKGAQELDTHPLLDLLRRPNPRQSGPELIEAAIAHLLLSGNAYLEVVRPDGDGPRELYALRPDRMRIVPDVSGVPRAYRYEVEGRSVDWPVDPISGASDVLHLRDFHPLDDWYGLSPIEAAASAIDQHNAAAEHNAALLQNGARPSGALVFRSDPGPDGIRRVEEALLDRAQGPRQAGRPLVLGGDVDWKELGFSPKDMDFAELKAQAAREIAAAFGVPHLLVVSGEATYSNRTDARLELWEHTVIPLLDRVSSALSSWLGPMFGDGLRLAHDLDEVPALAPRRRLKWQQIQQADFLTLTEKRQALGYQPIEEGEMGKTERKDAQDYEQLHGHPQPRDDAGRFSATGIDWGFVEQVEGRQLRAKVLPVDRFPLSGVTVATGFDLGSKDTAFIHVLFKDDPASGEEFDRLFAPYYGLKGAAAEAKLEETGGFSLTEAQAEKLDRSMRDWVAREVRRLYDGAVEGPGGPGKAFDALPREAQTAIASVAFNIGPNLPMAAPRFWGHVTRQEWRLAADELRNWSPRMPEGLRRRRHREASLLDGMLEASGERDR